MTALDGVQRRNDALADLRQTCRLAGKTVPGSLVVSDETLWLAGSAASLELNRVTVEGILTVGPLNALSVTLNAVRAAGIRFIALQAATFCAVQGCKIGTQGLEVGGGGLGGSFSLERVHCDGAVVVDQLSVGGGLVFDRFTTKSSLAVTRSRVGMKAEWTELTVGGDLVVGLELKSVNFVLTGLALSGRLDLADLKGARAILTDPQWSELCHRAAPSIPQICGGPSARRAAGRWLGLGRFVNVHNSPSKPTPVPPPAAAPPVLR